MFISHAASGRVRLLFPRIFAILPLVFASLFVSAPAAWAQAESVSGLKLPRFVSTRSNPINVRVGPGTKYDIAWNYTVSGVPVEIVQEFDTWRKIRDMDGEEGWVHQSLLVGTRAGYVTPVAANGEVDMYASRSTESGVRARLAPGVRVNISECDGDWCTVSAGQPGERANFSGYVRQEEIWGVYPDEVFD
ncbi:SH3 domain-containing protein [Devosia sp. LjRoot3]|uniref:SH3 domain-containing protein n=1 Tax=Devosia sp. LjRoot3 TaxID=3342319 RepID=UPI003ECEFB7F